MTAATERASIRRRPVRPRLAARRRAAGSRSAERPVRVLHAGPAIDSLGGMAAVVAEICAAPAAGMRTASAATWWPDSAWRSIAGTLGLLARLPRLRRSVDVVHVHLSERGSFLREGSVVVAARALGFVVAATLHGADFVEFAAQHPRLTGGVLRRADVVLCLGSRTQGVVEGFGVRRAVVLRNPIAEQAPPAPDRRARLAERRVVFAGVVGVRKGFDVLAAAWPAVRAAVPDAVLHVAGPAVDIDPAVLGRTEGVVVHGPLSREAVGTLLDGAAVACLPSRREALPMFVLESLVRGVDVVTSDTGELPDLAAIPAVHLLPNPIAPGALAERLVQVLRDADGHPAEAFEWVAENAFAARIGATLLAEYRDALAERGTDGAHG